MTNSSTSIPQQMSSPIENTGKNDEFGVELKYSERINISEIQSENPLLEDQLENFVQGPRMEIY